MSKVIEIVLATYNGSEYLADQINSITSQNNDFEIVVVDDLSTDNTIDILNNFLLEKKIKSIASRPLNDPKKGPCSNFARGLNLTTQNYIMLCDQDDIWLPKKVDLSFKKLKEMEDEFGEHTPLLVFTDLKIVDQNLNTISESFFQYQACSPSWSNRFPQIIVQNISPGCTMIFNRALLEKAMPIHPDAFMHDWWILLVASAFGQVSYLEEPTILYRQHHKNNVGAKKFSFIKVLRGANQARLTLFKASIQAKALISLYDNQLRESLSAEDYVKLKHFSKLNEVSYFKRLNYFISGSFRKNNLTRNIMILLILLFIPRKNNRN